MFFLLQDFLIFDRLAGDSIVTMGADSPDIHWQRAWIEELRRGSKSASAPPASSRCGWNTEIPVIAYVVTLRGAAYPDKDGLLQPLLRRWQAGGCTYSVFALPAVQAVIDWKWEKFCKKLLLAELACFLVWLAAFYTFTAVFQDEDASLSLSQLLQTTRGRITVACDVISLVAMAPFVAIEVSTVAAYGVRGWATYWNILDMITYFLQIFIVVSHLGRFHVSSGWLSIAAGSQCILLLFRLQYFSRVFNPTKFAFLDDIKAVLHDVRWYLVFIMLIVLGYSAAFQTLFRDPQDQKHHDEFSSLGKSFIMMITWAAGNADLAPLYKYSQNPIAACVIGVSFVFVLGMVLLNLLIGLMTNSLDRVTANAGVRLMLSKAQAIDEIEAVLPSWVERKFPHLFPPFLHVLRIDPDKLDAVATDAAWAKQGKDEERAEALLGGNAGEERENNEEERARSGSRSPPAGSTSRGGAPVVEGPDSTAAMLALRQQISELVAELRALREAVAVQQRQIEEVVIEERRSRASRASYQTNGGEEEEEEFLSDVGLGEDVVVVPGQEIGGDLDVSGSGGGGGDSNLDLGEEGQPVSGASDKSTTCVSD